ncbi:MAG: FAD binding domain-containing protein [Spirochaetaceae bacterium]|nr:FAD binding domain-containing protein [Spirochaetaceae bacterium]
MRSVQRYQKAASVAEALAAKTADPSAAWLAGGTFLLAGDGRDKPASVIDVGNALPSAIVIRDGTLEIGAGATFQAIVDSALPPILRDAALAMSDRNVRNRATLGGNLGARKSCSSLIPSLLALDAEVEIAGRSPAFIPLREWLDSCAQDPEAGNAELVLGARARLDPARLGAYLRWSRTSCDLALISVAVSFVLDGTVVSGLRIALGGMGPHSRRFPEIESMLELSPLPEREVIEAIVAPRLDPIDDLRASAGFKRLRGSLLVADAMHVAAGRISRDEVSSPPLEENCP